MGQSNIASRSTQEISGEIQSKSLGTLKLSHRRHCCYCEILSRTPGAKQPYRLSKCQKSEIIRLDLLLVASLLLVAMPGAPSSFLFLVAMPGAPSSFLFLVAMPGAPSSIRLD